MNVSIVLSGGIGERLGGDTPKQYQLLQGKEVLGWVMDALYRSKLTNQLLIVAREPYIQRLHAVYGVDCAVAGETHNESVQNALTYVSERYPACQNVLFVDAVRPFITAAAVDQYFTLLQSYDAVITTQRITDSLGLENAPFVDRANYFLIQKPEAFRLDLLKQHYRADSPATAIVQQLPQEARVYHHYGLLHNMKITYQNDLEIAALLMRLKGKEGEQSL